MIIKQCLDCRKDFKIDCAPGDPFLCLGLVCEPCIETRERAAIAARAKLELRSKFRRAVLMGELPADFRDTRFTLSDLAKERTNAGAWALARRWTGESNLYLHGDIGTGKTWMGLCCLHAQFVDGADCVFISARQLLKDSELFKEEIFKRVKAADFVLLDDIDKAGVNSRRIEALWEFFDSREREKKRTIITANIGAVDLSKHLARCGGANSSMAVSIVDRINPVQVLKLTGPSLRG